MSATRVPITELRTPAPRIVSLGVKLALLRASLDQYEQEWRRAVALLAPPAPFDGPNIIDQLLTDAEETHRYAADEDIWPVAAGEE